MARRVSAARWSPPHALPDAAGLDPVSLWGLALEGFADATRMLAAELDEALGIPLTWAEVLFRLRRTPDQMLPATRLAREVSFSSGGFTKLMDRLIEAGLVERQDCATDRRVVYAALTARGRELADRALEVHRASLRRHVVDVIGAGRLRSVAGAMRQLRSPARDRVAVRTTIS